MSAVFLYCCVLFLIIVLAIETEEPSTVINDPLIIKNGLTYLTDATFDDYLGNHSKVTVLFVSDEPLHLYSLAVMYDFERAAHITNNISNMSIEFAVYAGNEDTKIHDKLDIESYPVMKYFVHEQIIEHENKLKYMKENVENAETEFSRDIRQIDYNWKVVEHRVVTWLKNMNNPCYSILVTKIDYQYFMGSYDIAMIAYFDLESDEQNTIQMINEFDRVCKDFVFDHETQAYIPGFAVIFNKKLARSERVITVKRFNALNEEKRFEMQSFPALISHSIFKKHSWIFNGNALNFDQVWNFVQEERFPYIAKINGMNFLEYSTSHLPIVWICIDDDKDEYIARIERFYERLGLKFKNQLLFVWISSRNYIQHIRKLGSPWVPGSCFYSYTHTHQYMYIHIRSDND